MNEITMYTSTRCPFCKQAEALLSSKGIQAINKIYIDGDESQRLLMISRTQRRTVPQIYIGKIYVGGFDDLAKLERDGELDLLLLSA
jgi:glutaredoxin 3